MALAQDKRSIRVDASSVFFLFRGAQAPFLPRQLSVSCTASCVKLGRFFNLVNCVTNSCKLLFNFATATICEQMLSGLKLAHSDRIYIAHFCKVVPSEDGFHCDLVPFLLANCDQVLKLCSSRNLATLQAFAICFEDKEQEL